MSKDKENIVNIAILVLVVIIIGVVGLFLISPAGMFSKIAGKSCYDSDGGDNKYEKGWVQFSERRLHPDDICDTYEGTDKFWDCVRENIRVVEIGDEDYCINENTLIELWCNENLLGEGSARSCPNGCQDGRCL